MRILKISAPILSLALALAISLPAVATIIGDQSLGTVSPCADRARASFIYAAESRQQQRIQTARKPKPVKTIP